MKTYAEMSTAERAAWGRAELKTRKMALHGVKSAAELVAAQRAAEERRRAIGATRNEAAAMVSHATRENRLHVTS